MINDPIQIVFSALTLLGVGSILGVYISSLLDKKKELEFKLLEKKERRTLMQGDKIPER
ncbi:MAG: hypothetical protein ACREHC_02315 [Candidatus Levyibacteriota bacterium]